jgi:arylsulfatase A-like enzyme
MNFSKNLGLWVLALILFSCGQEKALVEPTPQAPVILITVDTLRSDRLPDYGYAHNATPAFSQLAQDGVLFEHAFAHSPLTLPSHASLFTGLLPTGHGARDNIGFKLDEQAPMITETLKQKGYKTGAAVSTMVLRRATGLDRGFDFYQDQMGSNDGSVRTFAQRRAHATLAASQPFLKDVSGDDPFFFWFHLYDPHTPYDAPAPYGDKGKDAYDGEIAYSDAVVGELLDDLKARGIYDKALIILTSDHGEGLGDHGEIEHGLLLYRESIQVPLIIKLPNNELANTRRSEPVALFDLAPTIANRLGFSFNADGVDLFSKASQNTNRDLYAESLHGELHFGWQPQKSVVHNNLHYIKGSGERLFDYVADPAETINLFGQTAVPSSAISLLETMGQGSKTALEVSEADLELLRSLGYSGGFETGTSLKSLDEAAFLELYDNILKCGDYISRGGYAEAEELLVQIVNRFPDIVDARILLGTCLTAQGKWEKAEFVYAETVVRSPNDVSALSGLLTSRLGLKKYENTDALVDKIIESEPVLGAQLTLPTLLRFERFDLAAKVASVKLENVPGDPLAQLAIARHHIVKGDPQTGLNQLQSIDLSHLGEQQTDLRSDVEFFMADAQARMGQVQQAMAGFDALIESQPEDPRPRVSKALLLITQQKVREALVSLDEWLSVYPTVDNYNRAAEMLETVGLNRQAQILRDHVKTLEN